jgi:hypothetical protein
VIEVVTGRKAIAVKLNLLNNRDDSMDHGADPADQSLYHKNLEAAIIAIYP